ncbi:unnamed protein product [Brachionus calyciflorus]|uniref:CBM21 domain-containing protein n=1 Tax=Brachionus calyciflorus TaxID=104777 RepID=A0A813PEJ2_9BILA|nr:unnamed protein product [Brachionus calyciflorus]
MRQDLVLTSNPQSLVHTNSFRFQTLNLNSQLNTQPMRTTRSSSLPLKIFSQNKNSITDKITHSWNGSLTCNRLTLYTHLSVSDYCLNLIGNDLPITFRNNNPSQKEDEKDSKESVFNISSDESSQGSQENISNALSSETETETESIPEVVNESQSETQFKLDEENTSKPEEKNECDLTLTTETSGYSSIAESTENIENLENVENVSLDETCRNLEDLSSSEDDLFKDFKPKKSCLKKLFIDTSDLDSVNATSSPLNPCTPTSPSFSLSSSSSINSTTLNSPPVKKRVSFADNNGKELFTVRTMSEPSNCPPKLTSKIVEYFLNREFNSNRMSSNYNYYSNYRNYDYGISALNYTNDMSSLSGSIAVYSLNFAQPSGDYLNFRKRLDDYKVCLENVVLNRFSISGTIKVKNIHFHKNVFIRSSSNKWQSYEDYQCHYVPNEYYSTPMGPSSPTSSYTASFYGNNINYQPQHKDFDTFRFQFDLPKTAEPKIQNNSSPNNTIQFCVCFRTGTNEEFWDNNYGLNYEILQYVIDIEKLKPSNQQNINKQPASETANFYLGKNKNSNNMNGNYFKYDSTSLTKASYLTSNNQSSGIYY